MPMAGGEGAWGASRRWGRCTTAQQNAKDLWEAGGCGGGRVIPGLPGVGSTPSSPNVSFGQETATVRKCRRPTGQAEASGVKNAGPGPPRPAGQRWQRLLARSVVGPLRGSCPDGLALRAKGASAAAGEPPLVSPQPARKAEGVRCPLESGPSPFPRHAPPRVPPTHAMYTRAQRPLRRGALRGSGGETGPLECEKLRSPTRLLQPHWGAIRSAGGWSPFLPGPGRGSLRVAEGLRLLGFQGERS